MNKQVFEEMRRIGDEFDQARLAHEDKKQSIIDTYGWDSEELKAWYAEKEAMKNPATQGEIKAYWAYRTTVEEGETEIELNEHLWDYEVEDFVKTLKKADVYSFIYTNTSTSTMDNIHDFVKYGCTLVGLCENKRFDKFTEKEKTIRGIRFTL